MDRWDQLGIRWKQKDEGTELPRQPKILSWRQVQKCPRVQSFGSFLLGFVLVLGVFYGLYVLLILLMTDAGR
jgi:hypothetical protein